MNSPFQTLVLAAGKGTRMKSLLAKVLHQVYFAPMIHHVLKATELLHPHQQIIVVGHQQERVKEVLGDYDVVFAEQKEQLGTGHAVLSAERLMRETGGTVMIICGDTPLIRSSTLRKMLDHHRDFKGILSVMTTIVDNPANYGRIISAADGSLLRIVEEKDATSEQRRIREINGGIYCVNVDFLCKALHQVGTDNKQGEVYLTDIVEIANNSGIFVRRFVCEDSNEILGVNSRRELALAHEVLQLRYLYELMDSGVTVYQPQTVTVESTVNVGPDTIIHPNTVIRGDTEIGRDCIVESMSCLDNCRLGDGVTIGASSYLRNVTIDSFDKVSPCTEKV